MTTPDLPTTELGPPLFSGDVRWSDLAGAVGATPVAVVLTTFEPGSGTAWHRHRHPQVLVVSRGAGVLELPDGVVELAAGDVHVVPGGVRHRHAAGGSTAMTHVSVSVEGDTELLS